MRLRTLVLAAAAAAGSGTAIADDEYLRYREYSSGDYAAQLVYRVDFASDRLGAQSLGLRFDHEASAARGAPALFHTRFGAQGLERLAVNGVDFRTIALASQQSGGGLGNWFANLSTTEIIFGSLIVATGVFFAFDAAEDDDTRTGAEAPITGGT